MVVYYPGAKEVIHFVTVMNFKMTISITKSYKFWRAALRNVIIPKVELVEFTSGNALADVEMT